MSPSPTKFVKDDSVPAADTAPGLFHDKLEVDAYAHGNLKQTEGEWFFLGRLFPLAKPFTTGYG